MNDIELIEAAAKIAGLQEHGWMGDTYCHVVNNTWATFDPLNDGNDALRLLIATPGLELYVSEIGATVSWRRDGSQHGFKCDEYAADHGGDLGAAVRRAIVRAVVGKKRGGA